METVPDKTEEPTTEQDIAKPEDSDSDTAVDVSFTLPQPSSSSDADAELDLQGNSVTHLLYLTLFLYYQPIPILNPYFRHYISH